MNERRFEGTSRNGNLQEAVDAALDSLNAAIGEDGVCDAQASWRLDDIRGRYGGFPGWNEVSVTISATRSPEWAVAPEPVAAGVGYNI